jgi:hypothetical protein
MITAARGVGTRRMKKYGPAVVEGRELHADDLQPAPSSIWTAEEGRRN